MWYYLIFELIQNPPSVLEVSKTTTLRGAMAAFTSFFLGLVFGPAFIKMLGKLQFIEAVEKTDSAALRQDAEQKKNTPTMGGVIILFSFLMSVLIWARLDNRYVLWAILAAVGFGLVGFLDDLIKAATPEKGLTGKGKMALMMIVSVALSVALWRTVRGNPNLTYLYFPFLRDIRLDLALGSGAVFMCLSTIVIVGSSNAVNLTDGMDGLAIGCTIIVTTAFAIIAYITGRSDFADYLSVAHIPGAGELAICCLALCGAGLAFLWYNCFPASVFMGDCGALMLGGFLGYIAVALRQEILLFFVGGIFVLEAVSVILQVASYKLTKKRIFRCAPIHHHFKLGGWSETKVTIRFWILGVVLAIFSIITLKIR